MCVVMEKLCFRTVQNVSLMQFKFDEKIVKLFFLFGGTQTLSILMLMLFTSIEHCFIGN